MRPKISTSIAMTTITTMTITTIMVHENQQFIAFFNNAGLVSFHSRHQVLMMLLHISSCLVLIVAMVYEKTCLQTDRPNTCARVKYDDHTQMMSNVHECRVRRGGMARLVTRNSASEVM